jgi:hypothetical protein
MNTSSLISDAFAIYSMAYSKIGVIGVKVVDKDKSPEQPKVINQLIEATMLFSVIERSIILNEDGDAILWVRGDVSVINNLLLKLKRVCGLYDYAVFSTPLTDIVLNIGGGGSSECCPVLTNVDTDADPIILDLDDNVEVLLLGGGITERKTWQIDNAGRATKFYFSFTISGSIVDDSHDQTMPANVTMSDARIVPGSSPLVWRPVETGEYQAVATSYNNGATWKLEISQGVFT